MVRDAWLFSSVVMFDDADPVRSLLKTVYDELELPFDPASVGAVHDESPDATLDGLEKALLAAYDSRIGLEPTIPTNIPTTIDDITLAEARTMVADHRVPDGH
jgi:hypothetical protein